MPVEWMWVFCRQVRLKDDLSDLVKPGSLNSKSRSWKKWEVKVTYVDHLQAAKPCSCHWVLRICVFVSMFSYSFAPTSRAQHFLEMTKMVVGNCFKFHLLGGFVKSCVFWGTARFSAGFSWMWLLKLVNSEGVIWISTRRHTCEYYVYIHIHHMNHIPVYHVWLQVIST